MIPLTILDLRTSPLTLFGRLSLEELLFRHSPKLSPSVGHRQQRRQRNYLLIGNCNVGRDWRIRTSLETPPTTKGKEFNIILGIGGKINKLVNFDELKSHAKRQEGDESNVTIIRRFTGGGTVVSDFLNTEFVSFIMTSSLSNLGVKGSEGPRGIMKWSRDFVYGEVFEDAGDESMVQFDLIENDYVIRSPSGNVRKIGGNAQAIAGDKFVHHTSFLFDYDEDVMRVLRLPERRPVYRGDKGHGDFVVGMGKGFKGYFNRGDLYDSVIKVVSQKFFVEDVLGYDDMVRGGVFDGKWEEWVRGEGGYGRGTRNRIITDV